MEWRCANCGRPYPEDAPPCEACGHDQFEPAVVRLRWECAACGELNADPDSPCRNCGLSEYVDVAEEPPPGDGAAPDDGAGAYDGARIETDDGTGAVDPGPDDVAAGHADAGTTDPDDAGTGTPDDAPRTYTEWQCTECGTGHPRNSPPCRRCGNMRLEKVEVEEKDVGAYVESSGWLTVEPRYLAGVVVVVVAVVLVGTGVVPLPDGGLGGSPMNATALEDRVYEAVNAERVNVGNEPARRSPALSDAAAAYARDLADDDHASTSMAVRVAETGAACADPEHVAAEVTEPGAFDDESALADALVDTWLDESADRRRLLRADLERTGVGVHAADDGDLYVVEVTC